MTLPRILIVDDLPSARETMAAHLRNEKYELRFATSGAEALQTVQANPPDTILLDVMMPDMTGYELCRRLRARDDTRHTPIVLVTALESKKHVAEGLDAGADDFLTKPVHGVELRARVRTMLRLKQQYDDLKAMLRTRDEVVAMLVHDMRSPLMGMMLHAEVLRRQPVPERADRSLDAIRRQTQRLQRLVDNLLMLAKLNYDAFALTLVPVDPLELVQRVVDAYRDVASASGVAIELTAPETRDAVELDLALVERVVDNLLSNAVKFSPAGSTVTVSCETSRDSGGRARLTLRVADQGPGIAPEDRTRIFATFGTGRREPGKQQTGLGLAFCRAVAEAHGGTIGVEDDASGGAVLVVRI